MSTLPKVPRTTLGSQGFVVSQQGLGGMGMSTAYGAPKPEHEMIELIRYAVDCGISLIDTSDVYGPHTNEILIGKAIKGIREKVQLCTKFGVDRVLTDTPAIRGNPAYVRQCLEGSLKRLDVDYIDLYYQHRLDTTVPIEITVGVLKEFVEAGKVKYIGLSEASATEIRRAHAVHPITAVQIEYSLWSRDVEGSVIKTCRELGIGVVAYSPLGRGFFSGLKLDELGDDDFRKTVPRFQLQNMERNKAFYEKLKAIGAKKNVKPGQLALAWVQHQGSDVVPIPGTTKRTNLDENISALGIQLSDEEWKEVEDAVPKEDVAGERYGSSLQRYTWEVISTPPLAAWNHETQSLHREAV